MEFHSHWSRIYYQCKKEITDFSIHSSTEQMIHMGQGIEECTKSNLWKTAFKKFEVVWSAYADHITSNILKAVFHKFYLVHS